MPSFQSVGTASATGTAPGSISVTSHSATTTDALCILGVVAKPYNAIIDTPSGWSLLRETTNGTVGSGLDSGSTKTAVFVRTGMTASTNFPVTVTGADSAIAQMVSYALDSGDNAWDLSMTATGSDSTQGADLSIDMSNGIDLAAGDLMFLMYGINSDNGSPSGATFTGFTGATLASLATRINSTNNAGNDCMLRGTEVRVSSGASNVAGTFSYTNSNSSMAAAVWIRLRDFVANNTTATGTDGISGTDSATLERESVNTDNVAGTDSVALSIGKTFVESLGLTDSFSMTADRNLAKDTLGLSDSIVISREFIATDSLGLDDDPNDQSIEFEVTEVDVLGATDSFASTYEYVRDIADSAALTDVVAYAWVRNRTLSADQLAATDSIIISMTFQMSPAFVGNGTFLINGGTVFPATPGFNGDGSLTSLRRPVVPSTAAFTGVGSLSAASLMTRGSTAIFTGSGTLDANLARKAQQAGAFAGEGDFYTLMKIVAPRQAFFVSEGVLEITGTTQYRSQVPFGSEGFLELQVTSVGGVAFTAYLWDGVQELPVLLSAWVDGVEIPVDTVQRI